MKTPCTYRIGIDVGTHSAGFAAIEVDEDGNPLSILRALSHIHDSGLDPDGQKAAITRKAASGVARRTRRLLRRRRRRLLALDTTIESLGWPLVDLEENPNPYLPWEVRAGLATEFIPEDPKRAWALSVALRHIARHRGWRNPYTATDIIALGGKASDNLAELRKSVSDATARPLQEGLTVGQIIAATGLSPSIKLRGDGGVLAAQTMQIDHANEIRTICDMQKIDSATRDLLLSAVFAAESPRGSAAQLVGRDALPGQGNLRRAPKASPAFQRYRIAAILANLRINNANSPHGRPLTIDERKRAFEYLLNVKVTAEPLWADVAGVLGVNRDDLRGTATPTADGDMSAARPPLNHTDRVMRACKVKQVASWWQTADHQRRSALVEALSNAGTLDEDSSHGAEAEALLRALPGEELGALDDLKLPGGRAAYSADSLRRLTERILNEGEDLHTARMAEFGVPADWVPPAEAIGNPVGNPAVDRVLKEVARLIAAAEFNWGAPQSVTIEHVRSGFASEAMAREVTRSNNKRAQRNKEIVEKINLSLGVQGEARKSDIFKFMSVTRQNSQCAYCGSTITYSTAELDHVVPRKGPGSTNTRDNLLAACRRCNKSKANFPFAVWAASSGIEGVSVKEALARTKHWPRDPGLSAKEFARFRNSVCERLQRTAEDPEIDNRSIESVAWMANELRTRIEQHFKRRGADTAVSVYRGSITFEARRASGIEKQIPVIGERGKTRLDRRHHAVDAAVITMTDLLSARVLQERSSLKQAQQFTGKAETWKDHWGSTSNAQAAMKQWRHRMHALSALLTEDFDQDRIPVTRNFRLGLGNGAAHEAKIHELDRFPVGSELSADTIERASSPALWCALTRHPDYSPTEGLPEDSNRTIRLHSTHLHADDTIDFFTMSAGCIAVRGGFAELGSNFHHARIYRLDGGKKPVFAMLRVYTEDLLRHRHEDLFSADIPPQAMSRRCAHPKLRAALDEGTATYLGWLVEGDELLIDMSPFTTNQIGEMLREFPHTQRWRVDGFYGADKLRLRPLLMSAEGLTSDSSDSVRKTLDSPGWRPAVNLIFNAPSITVIRRDSLGGPRLSSNAGLPTCWQPK